MKVACLLDLTLEKEIVAIMLSVFMVSVICFVCSLPMTLSFSTSSF